MTLADEIAAATRQQAEGLQQVTSAAEQMNGVIQHIAANAEQGASAAQQPASQSKTLNAMVARFHLATPAGGGHRRNAAVLRATSPASKPRHSAPVVGWARPGDAGSDADIPVDEAEADLLVFR